MKRIFGFFAAFAVCSSQLVAQTASINTVKLDSFMSALDTKQRAMCAVAVAKNGQILYERAIGYEQITPNGQLFSKSSPETEYRIGSISKTFTAVMIMQLVQEGKLTLDTKLSKFYPKIANAKQITVAEMLSHRSGIYSFTDLRAHDWTVPHTHEQILKIIYDHKPEFKPGEKYSYCNSNFTLLGWIIESVTKKPYAQNLEERITKPVALTHTYYGAAIGSHPHEAHPFQFDSVWSDDGETDMSVPGGAGAIVSTSGDLIQFIDALFKAKLTTQQSLDTMRHMTDGYGYGLTFAPFGPRKLYGHNGHIDDFESFIGYMPNDSMEYCVIGNAWQTHENDVLIGVLSIANNKRFEIPQFITLSRKDLEGYSGTYTSASVPVKFIVTPKGNVLTAQATGQGAFPLEALDTDRFGFSMADIVIEFHRNAAKIVDSFNIIQMGHSEAFKRD
jgi:D-alanyl-D-alanine carboxypeptidase